MLSKSTEIAKPELLTTALFFWNLGTNTFDFRMASMSLTILDMAQVFGLRPLDRTVDVIHDWALSSRPTAESLSSHPHFLHLEYNFATFKSYGTSFTAQDNLAAVVVGQDEDAADALILQEAVAEAKMRVKSRATRRTRATLVETSESEPEAQLAPTKKRTRAQTCTTSKSYIPVAEGYGEGLGKLPPCLVHYTKLPRPPLASRVTETPIPRSKKKTKTTTASIFQAHSFVETSFIVAPFEVSLTVSLPEFFKEFGQLKTKLRSFNHPFESSGLQDEH
ncbi:hypothetical protein D8674_035297 [Pyrus ussuriensis x Pyrus communis]|uniref:Uncharacterized protein n=1 Tax=Pyrus ussuriensis x Pyrus communis TaxID=2448454 RepID=A0A5N5GGK4_9ROSA|nr:hypothetical protein D8674_035297 [Pyrus ussuriensis x Pyrus communis]